MNSGGLGGPVCGTHEVAENGLIRASSTDDDTCTEFESSSWSTSPVDCRFIDISAGVYTPDSNVFIASYVRGEVTDWPCRYHVVVFGAE